MSVIVKGGGGKPEEEKTVTAGTSAIEVLPSSGKTMKKVTINPTPSQSKTVTPSTSQQTVSPDSGKLLSQVIVKAMEDVTPEVTAQTPVITQIAENLGVTITTPSGTNKQILQCNNANLLNIKDNAKKEGAYVWKKLTAEGGDFVDFAVNNNPTAYPDGGEQGGYWYEKVVEGVDLLAATGYTKIAVDKFTPTSDLAYNGATLNHSLGVTPYLAIVLPNNYNVSGFGTYVNFVVSAFFANNTKAYSQYTRKSSAIYVFQDNGTHQGAHSKTQISLSNDGSSHYFKAGIEYTLITMA